jgi:hypothetical protein
LHLILSAAADSLPPLPYSSWLQSPPSSQLSTRSSMACSPSLSRQMRQFPIHPLCGRHFPVITALSRQMRRFPIHPLCGRHFPVVSAVVRRIRGGRASASDSTLDQPKEGRFGSGGARRRAGASAQRRAGDEATPCAEAEQPPTYPTLSRMFFVAAFVSLHSDRRRHPQIRIPPFTAHSWTANLAFLRYDAHLKPTPRLIRVRLI